MSSLSETSSQATGLFRKDEWVEMPTHAWRRFFARMLDLILSCILLLFIMFILYVPTLFIPKEQDYFLLLLNDPAGTELFGLVFLLLGLILNAIIFGWFGNNLGKLLFGIKILDANHQKLRFKDAMKREAGVCFEGLALGFSYLTLLTLSSAYVKLYYNKKTDWDRKGNFTVLYRRLNAKQLFFNIFGFSLLIFFMMLPFLARNLNH